MKVKFNKEIVSSIIHDPRNNFKIARCSSEIRYDPLTRQISRIFPSKAMAIPRHDWSPFLSGPAGRPCPFCPENLEKATPRFPEDLIPTGRLKEGQAVVVPNLIAYDRYSGVVVMTPDHFAGMGDITSGMLEQSLGASLEFLRAASLKDPDNARYGTVDWNYMPFSGGSLIHPHLQVIAGRKPSSYVGQMIRGSRDYHRINRTVFWSDLLIAEEGGERYLGRTGSVTWLATFAPRGLGDVTAVIPGKSGAEDFKDEEVKSIASGILKVITYYDRLNIPAFNMALYLARRNDKGFWASLRLMGRFCAGPMMVSDVSYMQALLGDSWTFLPPEEMARDLKRYFQRH